MFKSVWNRHRQYVVLTRLCIFNLARCNWKFRHEKATKVNTEKAKISEQKPQRPPGGGRFLTDPTKVYQYNNWDDVTWDEEQKVEAKAKVEKNSLTKVSDDMKEKFEKEANSYWDQFYSQHQNKFFKDRHWLFTEFPELAGKTGIAPTVPKRAECSSSGDSLVSGVLPGENNSQSGEIGQDSNDQHHKGGTDCEGTKDATELSSMQADRAEAADQISEASAAGESFPGVRAKMRILEVGCGVGNTVFPVLQTNNDPGLFVYGCDLSATAVKILKDHPDYDSGRCHAFVCDVTDPDCSVPFPAASLDLVVLIFVLSAVHPERMQQTVRRLANLLKPGGLLVFRDYGRYDLAQLRFKDGRCLQENFYVRGDGTRVYFFTQEELREMFTKAGLVEEQNIVDRRLQVNRGRQLKMYRVWVQCKYRKPAASS